VAISTQCQICSGNFGKSFSLLLKNKIEIVAAGRTDPEFMPKKCLLILILLKIDSDYWIPKLNSFFPKDIVIYSDF
jgi:tRNA pseudouridine38-40 synthase